MTYQMGERITQIIPTDPNENYKPDGVYGANLIAFLAPKVTACWTRRYILPTWGNERPRGLCLSLSGLVEIAALRPPSST